MALLNTLDVETVWGLKSFDLYHADISKISKPIDILVVSAYVNRYFPTPGTVIEALHLNHGIIYKEKE